MPASTTRSSNEVARASRLLGMTPQTLRLFIREKGMFGVAVKGRGERYIYKVNWREVKEWTSESMTDATEKNL